MPDNDNVIETAKSETCCVTEDVYKDKPTPDELQALDAWMKEAREMTIEKLPEFMRHLSEDYNHDYGTICRAIAAAGVAACWAMERSPQGGITGFQAGCIMWDLIMGWMEHYKGKPMRLLNCEDMLYPQYAAKFSTISRETFEWLQSEAKKHLLNTSMHPDVREHMQTIIDGKVPFGYMLAEE